MVPGASVSRGTSPTGASSLATPAFGSSRAGDPRFSSVVLEEVPESPRGTGSLRPKSEDGRSGTRTQRQQILVVPTPVNSVVGVLQVSYPFLCPLLLPTRVDSPTRHAPREPTTPPRRLSLESLPDGYLFRDPPLRQPVNRPLTWTDNGQCQKEVLPSGWCPV